MSNNSTRLSPLLLGVLKFGVGPTLFLFVTCCGVGDPKFSGGEPKDIASESGRRVSFKGDLKENDAVVDDDDDDDDGGTVNGDILLLSLNSLEPCSIFVVIIVGPCR